MARRVDDQGQRIPIKECPLHGEYYADAPDAECPSCQDEDNNPLAELDRLMEPGEDFGGENPLAELDRFMERGGK